MSRQVLLSNANPDNFDMPMRLFWRSEVYDELCRLEDMLFPEELKRTPRDFKDDDVGKWLQFMDDFLDHIPAEVAVVSEWSDQPAMTSAFAPSLRRRIRQAQSVLGPLSNLAADHLPPEPVLPTHAVLLPWHLKQRLEYLLDYQTLPMVWIRTMGTGSEKVTAKRPPGPDL